MDRWFVCAKRGWGDLFGEIQHGARHRCSQSAPAPRDQHGNTNYFIGLQNVHASFGGRHYEPNFAHAPKLAIGRHMGRRRRCSYISTHAPAL
jgi:hypothetical protein